VWVLLEASVGILLDHFREGEGTVQLFVSAGSVDRIVYFVGDGFEEPVDLLFLSGWLGRIVVSH
jgi:hypothetical protein